MRSRNEEEKKIKETIEGGRKRERERERARKSEECWNRFGFNEEVQRKGKHPYMLKQFQLNLLIGRRIFSFLLYLFYFILFVIEFFRLELG